MKLLALTASLLVVSACASDDDGTDGMDSAADADTNADGGDGDSGADGSGDDGGDDASELGCAAETPNETTSGETNPLMDSWGAPCSTDADCVTLLGEGAVCDDAAVIYELPGGYCTKPCTLPDGETFVEDDPTCDPNGGVACVGQAPLYQRCAPVCTDDAQCNRDGYYCRQMPMIAQPDDPKICLMPDCCQDTCASE